MSLLDENLRKGEELRPCVQWAYNRWLVDCFNAMLYFRVLEVYRSPERQMCLYALGRWIKGKIVTWTTSGMHQKGLACDIYPLNCSYEAIEKVAKKYGITRPLSGHPYYDLGHFQFDNVASFPITLSTTARIKALKNGIERATKRGLDGAFTILQGTLKRLYKRSSKE